MLRAAELHQLDIYLRIEFHQIHEKKLPLESSYWCYMKLNYSLKQHAEKLWSSIMRQWFTKLALRSSLGLGTGLGAISRNLIPLEREVEPPCVDLFASWLCCVDLFASWLCRVDLFASWVCCFCTNGGSWVRTEKLNLDASILGSNLFFLPLFVDSTCALYF